MYTDSWPHFYRDFSNELQSSSESTPSRTLNASLPSFLTLCHLYPVWCNSFLQSVFIVVGLPLFMDPSNLKRYFSVCYVCQWSWHSGYMSDPVALIHYKSVVLPTCIHVSVCRFTLALFLKIKLWEILSIVLKREDVCPQLWELRKQWDTKMCSLVEISKSCLRSQIFEQVGVPDKTTIKIVKIYKNKDYRVETIFKKFL